MTISNSLKISAVVLATITTLGCSSMNSPETPKTSPDGMELKKESRSTIAYKKEGVNFSEYNKVFIFPSTVAFKKNWQRDYNSDQASLSAKIKDKDVLRIKDDLAKLFDETFKAEFGGSKEYTIVNKANISSGTLAMRPSIINLDVNAPDVRSASNIRNFVQTAGQATLFLEIYDAVSGEILARIVNAQEARDRGTFQWANRISNKADAKLIIKKWAKKLRTGFEKSHTK